MGAIMGTTNVKRRRPWILALLPLTLFAVLVGGCIVVTPDVCFEGERLCDNAYVLECIYDEWVVIQDCADLCMGTCGYINADASCLCRWPQPTL
jgi:hypothetical protein